MLTSGGRPDVKAAAWSGETITQVLNDSFGMRAESVTPLGGEVDQNSAVVCADGNRVVVKVAPIGVDPEQLRWQHRLLHDLRASPDIPPVPTIIAALDGSDVAVVEHDGVTRLVRIQTWLPGLTLAELSRHSPELLREWGRAAGQLAAALPQDTPAGMELTTHHWDVLRAPEAVGSGISTVHDPGRLQSVHRILDWFHEVVDPRAGDLPHQVVHQDLNDFNVLAQREPDGRFHISGVLDFTDALHTARVTELAIAVAYAMLRKGDPLSAAAQVVGGFNAITPLTDAELSVLYPIAAARLCVNAVTWTARESINGWYAHARMRHTWPALQKLAKLPPDLAEAWLRHAVGDRWATPASEVEDDLTCGRAEPAAAFDRVPAPNDPLVPTCGDEPARPFAGRHLTARDSRVARRTTAVGEQSTIHLGVDVHLDGPTTVRTPMAATVEPGPPGSWAQRSSPATLVLRHEQEGRRAFWSRWHGIATQLLPGQAVEKGAPIGTSGIDRGGGVPLRVCVFTSPDAAALAPVDFVTPVSVAAWRAICPDPGPFLGITWQQEDADVESPADTREHHFARSQRHYYRTPMRLVRSDGAWLYDENGQAYLDAINNVSHVGHANQVVCAAAARQMRLLNTNSRMLYDGIAQYAGRLVSLLPDPLEVVYLVCSGSEANDLALRIARQVTGRDHVMVIDGAYHGNTAAVTSISPNRYRGPGGTGTPATTREVCQPNLYRGPHRHGDVDAGAKYAADVAIATRRLVDAGTPPAAFIAESLMGTAGTIVFPAGYLAASFAAVRTAGGICISDEVQVGFGRLGDSFWGFERQAVVPDIVTMGKPIGNGHPMAAVVTTRELADAFDTGMKYFNTFGGNPVSCAVGTAVLDEIRDRELQASARDVGTHFLELLNALKRRHSLIGDVRGVGLYLGIELVRDRQTQEPASAEAYYISERMKEEGIVVYPTGMLENVLKIKPPMVFTHDHVDLFVDVLDAVLTRDW